MLEAFDRLNHIDFIMLNNSEWSELLIIPALSIYRYLPLTNLLDFIFQTIRPFLSEVVDKLNMSGIEKHPHIEGNVADDEESHKAHHGHIIIM